MAIILVPICFAALFLSLCINNPATAKREILLYTVLVFALTVTTITEIAGYFKLINSPVFVICWSVLCLGGIFYLYRRKADVRNAISNLKIHFPSTWKQFSIFEKILLTALGILLLFIFVQGIVYPPNNRDSLTYHMARIPSWISHQSVDPFPTAIVRQLYQPPLAEYIILHFNLLSRSDYFSASVQFFFLLFCLAAITAILKLFGLERKYQIMCLVLGATIPEVVLQASSTQNDIVVAFFVLAAFYFCLKSIKGGDKKDYLFFGLSVGLGLFAKGTAYLYLTPILLLFGVGVLMKTLTTKKFSHLLYAILMVLIIPLAINGREYYRNYSYSQNILGIDQNESKLYANERMSPKLFVCNALKNADLHMGILFVPRITVMAGKVVHKVFDAAHVDINDRTITYPEITGIPGDKTYYSGMLVASHEDFGGNFVHLMLSMFSIIFVACYIIKNKKSRDAGLLALIVVVQIIIFCAYLKWQPLGSRLQTSIFLLSVPLICYAAFLSGWFGKIVWRFALPFVLLYAFVIMLFNYARPYITYYQRPIHGFTLTAPTAITFDRYKKMFALNYNYKSCKEYRDITIDIKKSNYKNIGLIMGFNDWEYPLFNDCYTRELNPVHIMVTNYTKNITGYNDAVDCIVSTTTNHPFIDYRDKRFYNQDSGNTMIYYYK
jgi:hypothetical protein